MNYELMISRNASCKRRQKGKPVLGGITGTIKYGLESRETQTREGLRW
jgi:hypothetical protein